MILLIEDNPLDIVYTRAILEESNFPNRLYIISNGKDAIDFIKRLENHESAITPDLVLLDLNIPYKNGFELLSVIKANDELSNIPVFVLTTSTEHEDVKKAHKLNAYCYFIKPLDIDEFDRVLKKLKKSCALN
jgi:CheY-like chemotaxis protein